jgi:hypothetical protein
MLAFDKSSTVKSPCGLLPSVDFLAVRALPTGVALAAVVEIAVAAEGTMVASRMDVSMGGTPMSIPGQPYPTTCQKRMTGSKGHRKRPQINGVQT